MTQRTHPLSKRSAALWLAAILGGTLAACDRGTTEPVLPRTAATAPSQVPPAPGPSDPSLPDAKAALAAQPGKADNAVAGSDSSMTKAQESVQMPLPGQNNDHSLPSTEKRAGQGDAAAASAAAR